MNFIYALVLQVCITGVAGSCYDPIKVATHKTHNECAIDGYTKALEMHKRVVVNLPANIPVAVKFWCAKEPRNDI
jgi:hypothetical protein